MNMPYLPKNLAAYDTGNGHANTEPDGRFQAEEINNPGFIFELLSEIATLNDQVLRNVFSYADDQADIVLHNLLKPSSIRIPAYHQTLAHNEYAFGPKTWKIIRQTLGHSSHVGGMAFYEGIPDKYISAIQKSLLKEGFSQQHIENVTSALQKSKLIFRASTNHTVEKGLLAHERAHIAFEKHLSDSEKEALIKAFSDTRTKPSRIATQEKGRVPWSTILQLVNGISLTAQQEEGKNFETSGHRVIYAVDTEEKLLSQKLPINIEASLREEGYTQAADAYKKMKTYMLHIDPDYPQNFGDHLIE